MDMEPKNFKYNKEEPVFSVSDKNQCRTCRHAKEDVIVDGKVAFYGANNSRCKIYQKENKPMDVLLNNGKCEYYSR